MSRSYSASTRKRLWHLVMSTARPGLRMYVGTENFVGREGGGQEDPAGSDFHLRPGCCLSQHAPLDQA